jgi:hypothetical protein
MRENENPSSGSIFNAWKVFSKLYNALYCSRAKNPESEGGLPKSQFVDVTLETSQENSSTDLVSVIKMQSMWMI